jgi:hypothetical protein
MHQASPAEKIGQMVSGYWISQAIYVAAKLELADRVAGGPQAAEQLAAAIGAHAESLLRVLRALASVGVFEQLPDGRFQATPLSERLRRDVPGSQWAMALMMGEEHYQAWGELLHSVRTGEGAFRKVYGQGVFDYLGQHPEQAALFDMAMTSIHGQETEQMLAAYDFAGIGTLCDVGGGNGSTLLGILHQRTSIRGILFDLPHVIARAKANVERATLGERCELRSGSFFDFVPAGADAYLLRHIIHDWDDELSVKILSNCRQQLSPHARVLVVESVIRPGNDFAFSKWLDLTMLVIPEGKERTEQQYEALFAAAGLRLDRIVPTAGEISIVEAVLSR